jgi:hypothetical protein
VSYRVWRPPDAGEVTPYGRVSPTLRSNTIEFEIIKADADWRDKQLQGATGVYQNAADGEQRKAARKLRF